MNIISTLFIAMFSVIGVFVCIAGMFIIGAAYERSRMVAAAKRGEIIKLPEVGRVAFVRVDGGAEK